MLAAPSKRILLINPNTSSTTTERLLRVLSAQLPANVILEDTLPDLVQVTLLAKPVMR